MILSIPVARPDLNWGVLEPIYKEMIDRAMPYLQTRNNELHTWISYRYALCLLKQGGDATVVVPAILLHDVGWFYVPEELQLKAIGPNAAHPEWRDVHEREGARVAGEILTELGYPKEQTQKIVSIIAGHDSKEECDSPEEEIVKDADKLYRYSPEGFQWFAGGTSSVRMRRLSMLEQAAEGWFFTRMGHRLAMAEADARRLELQKEMVTGA